MTILAPIPIGSDGDPVTERQWAPGPLFCFCGRFGEAMAAASGAGSTIAAKVEGLLAPALEALGYGVVRVQFNSGRRATLQIMAERQDGAAMSLDDCAQISRAPSALPDVDDPLPTASSLHTSSP